MLVNVQAIQYPEGEIHNPVRQARLNRYSFMCDDDDGDG